MNHAITIGGLLKFVGILIVIAGAGIGLLWSFAKGMSDRP